MFLNPSLTFHFKMFNSPKTGIGTLRKKIMNMKITSSDKLFVLVQRGINLVHLSCFINNRPTYQER